MFDQLQLSRSSRALTILAICALLTAMSLSFAACAGGGVKSEDQAGSEARPEHGDEHGKGDAGEVKLSEQALKAAKVETAEVVEQSPDEVLRVTGTVETNQQQTQQVTPLVSGRVDRVNV